MQRWRAYSIGSASVAERVTGGGCCGALPFHLNEHEEARDLARRNIDAWWPRIADGVEAIVVTASGCGVMVKDYGHLLAQDPAYAKKAERVADAGEATRSRSSATSGSASRRRSRWIWAAGGSRSIRRARCSTGMKLRGRVEELLRAIGHELTPVADAHLCCGSAGTYSILQPELAKQLRRQKLIALQAERPEVIATANIGCQTHLASGTARPVRHWIELLDEKMIGGS